MKLTPEKLTAFCAALADTGIVQRACDAVDISRYTAYKWRKLDPEFAEAWDDALKAALIGLEDEAHRRAFHGVEEPIYHKGHLLDTVKRYSDTLAIFLLKAHAPDRYKDRQVTEHQGAISLAVVTGVPTSDAADDLV